MAGDTLVNGVLSVQCRMIGTTRTSIRKTGVAKVNLEAIIALASETPDAELRAIWGTSPAATKRRKQNKHPLTVREVGALADLHGKKLADVFAI